MNKATNFKRKFKTVTEVAMRKKGGIVIHFLCNDKWLRDIRQHEVGTRPKEVCF